MGNGRDRSGRADEMAKREKLKRREGKAKKPGGRRG
jgi:hypothetical protein